MKKILILLLILIANQTVFGQYKKYGVSFFISNANPSETISHSIFETSDSYKVNQHSYSLGLSTKYSINDTILISLRLGYSNIYVKQSYEDYSYGSSLNIMDITDKQENFQFAPGFLWKFNYRKFDFLTGFEIPLTFLGKQSDDKYTSCYDSLTMNLTKWYRQVIYVPKGFSISSGIILGFDFYPCKWISVGAEYSPAISFSKIKGGITHEYSGSTPPYVDTVPLVKFEDRASFFVDQRCSLKLSIWF